MSDSKRTGSRDISELKQRLGLKKGGAAPTTGATRSNGTGGVVPPPGLNLPPPPGVAPAQPVIPNAADDPFGAMNAMAAVGKVQRAPEIVIVNDGKPVENVGSKSLGTTIARIAIPAVVALGAGIAIGKIGTSAAVSNDGLTDLRGILGDEDKPAGSSVYGLNASLLNVKKVLEEWEKTKFKPNAALEKKLEGAVKALEISNQRWFSGRSKVEAEIAGKIYAFYGGVSEVRAAFEAHTKTAGLDSLALKTNEQALKDNLGVKDNDYLRDVFKYGILIQGPDDKDKTAEIAAKVVELGPPYCSAEANAQPATGKCPDGSPLAFAYRSDPGGTWQKAEFVKDNTAFPTKKLLVMADSPNRNSLVQKADGVASEVFYAKRLQALYERIAGKVVEGKPVGGLLDEGNKLVDAIKGELASKKERFTFFM